MKAEPIGERVLIDLTPTEEKTAGGLIIPETAQEKSRTGTVIAYGKEANTVKLNDIVLLNEFSGVEVSVSGKEYVIIKEREILMILKK